MKVRFIFNPFSGRNRRNPYLRDQAIAFIAEHGLDGSVVTTERPRHATDLARQAVDDGCGLVVAIGGDGTMNEVATGLVNSPAAFGLIPCGSGNGLGRHVGIRRADRAAFETLLRGRVMPIDTGMVNGCSFFNAMGLGFEADIAVRFSRQSNRGLIGYLRVGVPSFFSHRPESVTVHWCGGTVRLQAFTLAVMNSEQYGNDACIAPGARVDDGCFDLVSVPQTGFFGACRLLCRLAAGTFDRAPGVMRLAGSEFVIERAAPGWIHTDGEPHSTTARLEIKLQPKALRIMVPERS